jgi:hypothetical protein
MLIAIIILYLSYLTIIRIKTDTQEWSKIKYRSLKGWQKKQQNKAIFERQEQSKPSILVHE